ncbi:ATP-binding protein [Methylobacterium marchantiae]|uniref:histidine kinase n=1 Tax=Methylobacterium marchantiae TaxID=600331 RepID=A0ABW3WZB8_9HYPH|nr:Adaptive-response sensory-kinase SasA [Methylobacterium marchantiae]
MKASSPRPKPLHGPARPHSGSLQRRLIVAALVLVTIALVVAGIAIGFILHRFVRGQLDSRLDSQIVAIASSLERGRDGRLALRRNLDGPPFDRERSGWSWQIRQGDATLRSSSLEGHDLPAPAEHRQDSRTPHPDHPQPADGVDPWGNTVILRILTLPDEAGAGNATIVASAPMAALSGPVREAGLTLALILSILGLCLVVGLVAQVRLGLRPLERLRRDLGEIRAGKRAQVPEKQPAEIRPLVREVNALLSQNAVNLERARTHVANLAHGLKTPLATLTMALGDAGKDPDGRLSALVSGMDAQIRHHLRRARTAALGGATRERTDLAVSAAGLRTTFARLYADKGIAFTVEVSDGIAVACDGQDVDEMLGNLIDNACRWCRAQVWIAAAFSGQGVTITVEDDGPGLDEDAAARVLGRGRRLDETVPGHGFGLSITTELAELYGGSLHLDRGTLHGLRARLELPA